MDAGASASARPAGLPVHDARPVGYAHPASMARPAGAASHSRKGAGRGLDRPLAASAAGPRPAITARRPVNSLKDRGMMPAVALFSLSAVLGLLYLSSGNLKAPPPHLRQDVDARHSMRSDMARLPMPVMWIRRKRTQSGRKVKNMNLEDLIVSTISDTKPMMILALCTIVLFVMWRAS